MQLKNFIVTIRLPTSNPRAKGIVQKVKIKAENHNRATQLAKMQYGEVLGPAVTDFDANRAEEEAERARRELKELTRRQQQDVENLKRQQRDALQTSSSQPADEPHNSEGLGLIGTTGAVLGSLFGKADRKRMSPAEIALRSAVQSAARSTGSLIARQVLRGVLDGLTDKDGKKK
jgi:hypothetical protein